MLKVYSIVSSIGEYPCDTCTEKESDNPCPNIRFETAIPEEKQDDDTHECQEHSQKIGATSELRIL